MERVYCSHCKADLTKAVAFGVKTVFDTLANDFAQQIRRAAADLAADLYDAVNPEIRKQLVTTLGNCAEAFESLITSVAEDFVKDKI